MARTLEEINREYTDNCAKVGDSIYRRSLLDSTINALMQKNAELQTEAREAEAAAAAGGSNESGKSDTSN